MCAAADIKAKEKRRKHAAAVEAIPGNRFLPFILECFGAFHAEAVATIEQLAAGVNNCLQREFRHELATAVAVQLAMGNADLLATAAHQSRTDIANGVAPTAAAS